MQRDPQHIARTLKLLRAHLKLTQENLAHLAGLTTRTIEKAESGRHAPNEQTLSLLAKAIGCDAKIFYPLSADEEAQVAAEIERTRCKRLLVETRPATIAEFMANLGSSHAFVFDDTAVEGETAIEDADALRDHLTDCIDIWDDVHRRDHRQFASFAYQIVESIRDHGFECYVGRFRQQRERVSPPLVFDVALVCIQPAVRADADTRYSLIELQPGWEVPEEDRPPAPCD